MSKLTNIIKLDTLKARIALILAVEFVAAFTIVFILTYTSFQTIIEDKAKQEALDAAYLMTNEISKEIEKAIEESQTLADDFAETILYHKDYTNRDIINLLLRGMLNHSNAYAGIRMVWEPNAFDGMDAKFRNTKNYDSTGRFAPYWIKDYDGNLYQEINSDYHTAGEGDYYMEPKRTRKPYISAPEERIFFNRKTITTVVSVPILVDYQFAGVVGVEINMNELEQRLLAWLPLFEGEAKIELIDHKGHIVAGNTGKTRILGSIDTLRTDWELIMGLIARKQNLVEISNSETIQVIQPIVFNKFLPAWALSISHPLSISQQQGYRLFYRIAWAGLILLIGLIILTYWLVYFMLAPFNKVAELTELVSEGNVDMEIETHHTGQEIRRVTHALKQLQTGLQSKSSFAKEIEHGNFEFEFKPESTTDLLGLSLLEMRDSLKKAKEIELERKEQDNQQNWANKGLTKFNEILRDNKSNIKQLSYSIISKLVNYMEANQGALFLYNEENTDFPHLQLMAAFAYNEEKHMKRKVRMGEGLLGAAAIEKNTYYFDPVPESYIKITSGLGHATPNRLLIIPLVLEGRIFGALEIASFSSIKPYQIEFVKRLAEIIASTLNSTQINERTKSLLEQSRSQSEEMAAQEEEMRQNLEELQATQEESARREAEMSGIIKAISSSFVVYELDTQMRFINFNQSFEELSGFKAEKISGKKHNQILREIKMSADDYSNFVVELKQGIPRTLTHRYIKENKHVWIFESYSPILDVDNDVYKIMVIGQDVTEAKEREIEISKLLSESQKQSQKLGEQESLMHRNLEEMLNIQQEVETQYKEMEQANTTMRLNELRLQKAYKKSKQKSDLLQASEEKMRRTLSDLEEAHKDVINQKAELEEANNLMRLNELKLKRTFKKSKAKSDKLEDFENKIKLLEAEIEKLKKQGK